MILENSGVELSLAVGAALEAVGAANPVHSRGRSDGQRELDHPTQGSLTRRRHNTPLATLVRVGCR